jgi:GTP cyclohydrolase II
MRTAQTGIPWRVAVTRMPTKWGMFSAIGFERQVSNGSQPAETALAIVLGELTSGAPLLRIHSQCFTGEVLGSLRCDCNVQLEMAHRHGRSWPRDLRISGGPRHWLDGKAAGLRAAGCRYRHRSGQSRAGLQGRLPGFQLAGRDTARPRRQARSPSDEQPPRLSLCPMSASRSVARIPCEAPPTPHSLACLQTKKEKMGHALSLRQHGGRGIDVQLWR